MVFFLPMSHPITTVIREREMEVSNKEFTVYK